MWQPDSLSPKNNADQQTHGNGLGLQETKIRNELEEIDLSQHRSDPSLDFCNQMADILKQKFTSEDSIKSILSKISITGKIDELLDYIIEFYNAAMVNHIIKIQLKKVYELHSSGNDSQTILVNKCIDAFSKIPSAIDLNYSVIDELVYSLHLVEELVFVELIRVLYKSGAIKDFYIGAFGISQSPQVFQMEDPQDESLMQDSSQYIMYCFKNIITAIDTIYKGRDSKQASEYEILTSGKLQVNSNIPLDKIDLSNVTVHPALVKYMEKQFKRSKESESQRDLPLTKNSISFVKKAKGELGEIISSNRSSLLLNTNKKYSPKVLSMTHHLTKNVSVVSEQDYDPDSGSDNVNFKLIIANRNAETRFNALMKYEKVSAFLSQGVPIIEVVDDVGGLDATILKFLRLKQGAIQKYAPHRIWLQVSAAALSVYFTKKLMYSTNGTPRSSRVYRSIAKGFVFLTYGMTIAINIYIDLHPGTMYMPEKDFWLEVALFPLIFSLENVIWNAFTPIEKELFCRKCFGHRGKVALDLFNQTVYNSGVFYIFGFTFFTIPNQWWKYLVFIIPGLVTAAGQNYYSMMEKTNLLIRYLIGTIFSANFIRREFSDNPEKQLEQGWQPYVRLSLGLTLCFYSGYFCIKTWRKFSEEYINEDTQAEIIIKNIKISKEKAQLVQQRLSLESEVSKGIPELNGGILLSEEGYKELKDDLEQGRDPQAFRRISNAKKASGFSTPSGFSKPLVFSKLYIPGETSTMSAQDTSALSFQHTSSMSSQDIPTMSSIERDQGHLANPNEPSNPPIAVPSNQNRSKFICGSCAIL